MHLLTPSFILEMTRLGRTEGQFDAIVLFIDTSGFTPLTIRLTEHGREGSEILADILQTVFAPLVQSVYAHGGFIAGFAGDAFKAIFPTLDASSYLHALAAAAEVRTHMAANPSHQTIAGSFDFSVRLSIASGPVAWAIWSAVGQGEGQTEGQEAGEAPKAEPTDETLALQTRGYTFYGRAIEEAIQGEDHADGGELVVTQAVYDGLLAALPNVVEGHALEDAAEGYVGINRVADTLLPKRLALADQAATVTENASDFYPLPILTSQTLGEFRPVYTLFVNVQRLPSPGDDDDFLPLLLRLLHQYGGYLCRIGRIGASDPGGTFLLFWGAPTSHENGLERVISFVLALRASTEIPMRAGITYDVVYAGFVGSRLREEYTCHGRSVNQAARQMATASWNQILLDSETARRAQDDFDVTLAGRFHLKGLTAEQPLFSLAGHRALSTESLYQVDFVGREKELVELQRAIKPICSGGVEARFGGITLVRGEAGIGKSRLVHEFLMMTEALEDVQTFIGQVDEIVRESLNPFRYFLRRYFQQSSDADEANNKAQFDAILETLIAATAANDGALSAELSRTRSFLGALINLHWAESLYDRLEPQLRFENMLIALKTLIQAESLRRPLILLLEDGQWLDGDSLDFLERLVRNVDNFPFAILITARPPEEESPEEESPEGEITANGIAADETAGVVEADAVEAEDGFEADGLPQRRGAPTRVEALADRTIIVYPLSDDDLADLAHDLLDGAASAELAALLTDRSEGNPFFAEQLILYLQEEGLLEVGSEGWQLVEGAAESERAMPTNLQTVLVSRLDRLTQEVKQVVQTAAVLGREFSVQVLTRMLRNDTQLETKMLSAQASSVWDSLNELRYLFRHALLRDAAYEMQLRAQLRRLHRLAAGAIETLYAEVLSTHYGDLVYHYSHAGDVDKERIYARKAGEQTAAQYDNRAALVYYTRALELTSIDLKQGRFDLLLAREYIYDLIGDNVAQKADLDQLIALSIEGEWDGDGMSMAARQAKVAIRLTKYHEQMGDLDNAIEEAGEAIRLSQIGNDPESESTGYFRWCIGLWKQGYYEEARAKAEIALSIAQANRLPRLVAHATMQLGNSDFFYGRYAEAETHYTEILAIYRELNDLRNEASTLSNLGLTARYQGNHRLARECMAQSLQKQREVGSRRGEANTILSLGGLSQDLYEFSAARSLFHQSRTAFHELGNRNGEMLALANLSNVYSALGEYQRAQTYNEQALQFAETLGNRRAACLIHISNSALNLFQHQHNEALLHIQQGLALSEELSLETARITGLKYLGHVLVAFGQPTEAKSAYVEALDAYRAQKEPAFAIEIIAFLAQMALAEDNQNEAMDYAQEIFAYLEAETLYTVTEPIRVYFSCYQVLYTYDDKRAMTILQAAYGLLQELAINIDDQAMRNSFLNNIAVHRDLVLAYETLNADNE